MWKCPVLQSTRLDFNQTFNFWLRINFPNHLNEGNRDFTKKLTTHGDVRVKLNNNYRSSLSFTGLVLLQNRTWNLFSLRTIHTNTTISNSIINLYLDYYFLRHQKIVLDSIIFANKESDVMYTAYCNDNNTSKAVCFHINIDLMIRQNLIVVLPYVLR